MKIDVDIDVDFLWGDEHFIKSYSSRDVSKEIKP